MLPGGLGGGKGVVLIAILAVGFWLFTGFYRVQPNQHGVELIFGKLRESTTSGLNYNLPWPIGEVFTPEVTTLRRTEVGVPTGSGFGRGAQSRALEDISLMLTGDENIIDIEFVVFWDIADAYRYLFKIAAPEETVRSVSESVMRDIIGRTGFERARTEGRGGIQDEAKALIQRTLDDYQSGIRIRQVETQKADPPSQVFAAFRDVQAARADKERQINDATGYRNEKLERAQGEAERIVRGAEAYREEKIERATGEASRFVAVHEQFRTNPNITQRRIYLETMEEVMRGMEKILIDQDSGAVPYLPLDTLRREGKAQ